MDTDLLIELVPHYVAMLVLVFLVLGILRAVAGDLGFWVELAIIFVVVFLYRPAVQLLDVAPSAWERQ
ncbi:hypothetical protein [Natronococcus occultus]|uniref:Uncharacterized protein n=1 Tax=Natronococcus occultus SP4 TaxID=694430 RepID=L0K4K1_9EURY|nr:hypothetical protein [Natronococcus occultus]AGB39038.1 hypothetical protein Natoc_3302 [Natronococcus occultus SP4]